VNSYRINVMTHLSQVLADVAPARRALDFGSGDGWFARALLDEGLAEEVVAVDVKRRSHSDVEPVIYDGRTLPFEDRAFDLVYAIDVIHHAEDPRSALRDALRCCSDRFVLKDHTYADTKTRLLISVFDELGNRRFGVPSPHNYQHQWEWLPTIEHAGFARELLHHPIRCETRPVLRSMANGFQFIGRWRRAHDTDRQAR
jgi:SAM-dependent methyltransferase